MKHKTEIFKKMKRRNFGEETMSDETKWNMLNFIERQLPLYTLSERSICTTCKSDITKDFLPKLYCPECGNEWNK
jgi:hypothetical protein